MHVSGVAWMDHQWGNFVVAMRGGWDWYSLQFDDSTELMLYVLRAATGETTAVYGTYVQADGQVRDLAGRHHLRRHGLVDESAHGRGLSVRLAGEPAGRGAHPGDAATAGPGAVVSRESPGLLQYWEGTVTISGDRSGHGYVELTGYAS